MIPPDLDREYEILTLLSEAALAGRHVNGHESRLPEDVRWLMSRFAVNAAGTAIRCSKLMAVLDPEITAAVRRLATESQDIRGNAAELTPDYRGDPATPLAGDTSHVAGSEATGRGGWLTVMETSQRLNLTPHSVRSRCRRGWPAATRTSDGWRIDREAVEQEAG